LIFIGSREDRGLAAWEHKSEVTGEAARCYDLPFCNDYITRYCNASAALGIISPQMISQSQCLAQSMIQLQIIKLYIMVLPFLSPCQDACQEWCRNWPAECLLHGLKVEPRTLGLRFFIK